MLERLGQFHPHLFEMPYGRGGGYRELTAQEKQERDNERKDQMRSGLTAHFEALAEELVQGKSERLTNFLTCSARLNRLSPGNQELVYSQCPDATFVATFPTWTREYNRAVMRGEKAIWILQPKPFEQWKKTEHDAQSESLEAETGEVADTEPPAPKVRRGGDRGSTGIAFRPLAVFDLSQTQPIPGLPVKEPPAFFTPLEGPEGIEILNTRLEEAMTAEGITVSESVHTGGAEGYNVEGVVVTKEGLAPTNKALVRIHEWTHNLLHHTEEGRRLPRGKKECHAEAVAFVVMKHLTGFSSPFTADYLLHFENKPDQLREEMETILGAAQHIIEAVHKQESGAATFQHPSERSGEAAQ